MVLDLQEAGISLGTPLSEIAEAVGVAVAPHDWYAEEWDTFSQGYDDPWDAYVDNVLSVFGMLQFVGGDGVQYSGWLEDFSPATPANFEEALASTGLSMIGTLPLCD